MQINNSTPSSTQNFGAAKFYKVPAELQEVMKANKAFNNIARKQDIIVTATPRATWRDPLRLRTPKSDEKCYLDYVIKDIDFGYGGYAKPVATNSSLIAPLQEHVQTLLKTLEVKNFLDFFRSY